jgi:DivIVA domain-containing protein
MSPEPHLDATGIARRHFSTARKGYDPEEVRAFLHELSDLVGRLQRGEAHERERAERAETRAELAERHDQHRLVELLGEETARVLDAAREAAADIRSKAEESAARMVLEAHVESRAVADQAEQDAAARKIEIRAEADELRREAEAEVERRRSEGQRVVDDVRREAGAERERMLDEGERARRDAEAAAEQIRASARDEGRRLVGEAQTVRERMLGDLARRRRTAREQLERLNAARERLLAAYEVVKRTVDEATTELTVALPEAKLASEVAMRRVNDEPEDTVEVLEAELSVARMAGLVDDAGASSVSDDEFDSMLRDLADDPGGDNGDAGTNLLSGRPDTDRDADHADERAAEAVEAAEATAATESEMGVPALAPDAPAAVGQDQAGVGRAVNADRLAPAAGPADAARDREPSGTSGAADDSSHPPAVAEVASGDEGETGPYVDELFARIRAERRSPEHPVDQGGGVAVAVQADAAASGSDLDDGAVLDRSAASAPEGPHDATGDVADRGLEVLNERDAVLAPVERELGRRLKRVLADEQNEVLDLLRRGKTVSFDDVVPAGDEHADRYAVAATVDLDAAAGFGAASVGGDGSASCDELADKLGRTLVEPLRERVQRSFDECDGDLEEVTERLRALYREWKGQHIGDAVRHYTVAAYAWGAYEAAPAGTELRWLVDRSGDACPDADDNALAGRVRKGDTFPTGDRCSPAHPGCRCLVVPAGMFAER